MSLNLYTTYCAAHTHTQAENIRLLMDKWMNLHDRLVSGENKREGGNKDGREGMREKERKVDMIEWKMV